MLLPPLELYIIQLEFSKVITAPFISSESEKWAIYHRLYWCRLSRFFHEHYPFLTRLFGFQEMQDNLIVPYLLKNRPSHWLLSNIGNRFIDWLTEHYQEKDRQFILEVAELDDIYDRVKRGRVSSYPDGSSSQLIYLQPHVTLAFFSCDLITFRNQFLTESVDYWQKNPFPKMICDEPVYCVIFLCLKEGVQSLKISQKEFELLHTLKTGKSLEKIVEINPENQELPFWIYEWAHLGLLAGSCEEK